MNLGVFEMDQTLKFWKESEKYGELSNFYPLKTPIIYKGKSYKTSEHLYHAMKYLHDKSTPEDIEYADVIRQAKTPYMSKILANQEMGGKNEKWRLALQTKIQHYKSKGVSPCSEWENIKVDVMKQVLRLKFNSDLHCKKVLLSTGTNKLEEASPYDLFWGSKGKNMLGLLLMEIRDDLTNNDQVTTKKRKSEECEIFTKKPKMEENEQTH